jgi:integrase/recombinase XerC
MDANDNSVWIERYIECLIHQRRLSPHTTASYRRDLHELHELIAALPAQPVFAAISHAHIRRFAAQLHAHGLHARSIARRLSAWRVFFEWLSEQIPLSANPVDGVKAPKHARALPKALAADDAVRLVEHAVPGADRTSTMQRCNRAMFELLYSSGLRVAELTGLDVQYVRQPGYESLGWIDFDDRSVTVTGKGQKMRSIPVGEAALAALRAWLEVRTTLVKTDAFPLFLTERGSRMSPRVVQLRLKAHAQAIGIPADVHPHVLRHSFASHLLQSSGDLRAVQEMLGHASIAATQVYTSLDFQRLAQVYDATHPRAKIKKPSST